MPNTNTVRYRWSRSSFPWIISPGYLAWAHPLHVVQPRNSMANPLSMKKKKSVRACWREGNWNGSFQRGTGCSRGKFGSLGHLNPCSWHRSERFFLFWGGKGRRIIKIDSSFKKKNLKKKKQDKLEWIELILSKKSLTRKEIFEKLFVIRLSVY